jgi:hypothetical protein
MGDKIRSLIEEGQKALGKEVVVMNDEEGDEEGAVDDGMDGWEEEVNNRGAMPASPTSSSYRTKRRPSQAFSVNASISPPNRSGAAFPTSHGRSPTSPNFKRGSANGKLSQNSSASTSPYLNVPSSTRLGSRNFDGFDDYKVIYEPPPVFSNSNLTSGDNFEDADSRGLAERMENIRKAYRIQ